MSKSTAISPEEVDDVLNVLARPHCHCILHYFRQYSTEVATVDELVEFSAAHGQRERDETRVAIRLHHSTLPRLADADVIDYDARSNTARYRSQPAVELWLDHVSESDTAPR